MDQITLATRQSELALCQAHIVKNLLMAKYPSMDFAIKGMTTTGDNSLGEPLYKIGGKALFMKELEIAMKNNQAELAVQLNVSRQAVNAIETGKHDPSLPLAFRIGRLFDMTIEEIFDDEFGN